MCLERCLVTTCWDFRHKIEEERDHLGTNAWPDEISGDPEDFFGVFFGLFLSMINLAQCKDFVYAEESYQNNSLDKSHRRSQSLRRAYITGPITSNAVSEHTRFIARLNT